jgi:hypothetical protein
LKPHLLATQGACGRFTSAAIAAGDLPATRL